MARFILTLATVMLLTGCNVLAFPSYVLFGGSTTKVKAEYPHLHNQKIAIIVSAGPGTDFEYPYGRTDVALATAQAIAKHVKDATFVEQEKVNAFQQATLDWITLAKPQIARQFNAQQLIWLDLIQFTTREESSVNLLRGRLTAAVRIYDINAENPHTPQYETEIAILIPSHGPMPASDLAQQQIYRQMIILFAEQLTQKFYTHKVPAK